MHRSMHRPVKRRLAAVIGAASISLVACGPGADDTRPDPTAITSDGEQTGTVTVVQRATGSVSDEWLEQAAAAIGERLRADGDDADVTRDGDRIIIVIRGVTRTEAEAAAAKQSPTAQVSLRAVLGCVTAEAGTETTETTGVAPPDSEGRQVLPLRWPESTSCQVGPVLADGSVFAGAQSQITSGDNVGWAISVQLTDTGLVRLNEIAAQCFEADASCPTRQLAIVVGDIIVVAPLIEEPRFDESILVSGEFSKAEAEELAAVINASSQPVQLVVESVDFVAE